MKRFWFIGKQKTWRTAKKGLRYTLIDTEREREREKSKDFGKTKNSLSYTLIEREKEKWKDFDLSGKKMTWKHNKKEFETHWIEKERKKERKKKWYDFDLSRRKKTWRKTKKNLSYTLRDSESMKERKKERKKDRAKIDKNQEERNRISSAFFPPQLRSYLHLIGRRCGENKQSKDFDIDRSVGEWRFKLPKVAIISWE